MKLLIVLVASLALAAPAAASERHPTQNELESQIMCPVCKPETLDQSNSAIAQRMKRFIAARIAAGDTRSEIKAKLVAQFGRGILAEPQKHGFDLVAWVLPLAGIVAAALAVGALAWRWSRTREPPAVAAGGPPLDPELERRVDEELRRFDG